MMARLSIVLIMLSLVASPTRAEERRRVIVVPTELGGFFTNREQARRDVDLALQERLRTAQFTVPTRSPLSPSEADCREFDCLARIADAHGANIVVAGRLVSNQAVTVSYHLRIRVAEKTNGKIATREREKDCENCTESQARDMLATLMSAVIANEPESAPPVPPTPAPTLEPKTAPSARTPTEIRPPLITSPPPATTRDRFSRNERIAFATGGALVGAAGVYFLAQGIAEKEHNGDVVIRNGQRYRIDTTTTGQPLFFSLSAVSLLACVGLEVAAWYPWKVKIAPAVSSTGARVQVGWSF